MLDIAKAFFHNPDLGFITDLRGAILAATAGAEASLGYSQAELVGLDLSHLDDAGDLRRFLDARPPRSRRNLGFHLRTRPGSVLTVGAMATRLCDEAGESIGWFFSCQDLNAAVSESREAQPILDALVESIGAALWSFDRNGTVITWGRACEQLFGVRRAEAEGRLSVVRLFPSPADYRRVVETVDRAGRFTGELALVDDAGASTPHQVTVTPLVAGGLAVGYTAVSFDLAERRRLEEFRRILFEQAGEAIAIVDTSNRRIIEANAKAWEIHGYTREEFLQLDVTQLLPPDMMHIPAIVGQALQEKGRYETDRHVHRRKDGSAFPCAVNLRKVSIGNQQLAVCIYRDLTEQRKAEEFFRALFEKASDAIYLVDDDGMRIVEANEAACRLIGYTREEFLKLRVPDLVPHELRHRIPAVRKNVQSDPGYQRDRRMVLCKDGRSVATDNAISRVEISGRRYFIASLRDLTAQERAAQELEEANRFLEHVQENAGDGLVLLDENGVYVAVNRKLLEIRQEKRENLIGKPWTNRVEPAQRAAYEAYWEKLMRGERVSMRTTIEPPGAPTVIVDVSSTMILRGSKKYVFAIIRDVTGAVRAEEELKRAREDLERHVAERTAQLRESEERFRATFTQGGIGMALIDTTGRYTQVNRFFCEMLGYTESELQAMSFLDMTPKEDGPKNLALMHGMLSGELPSVRVEQRCIHRKGHIVWADVSAIVIRDPAGSPLYFVTSIQDITERKRAESELRDSEERFRGAFTQGGIGMALVSLDGSFIQVNRSICEMLGYSENELLGTAFPSLTVEEDRERSGALFQSMIRGEIPSARFEKRYRHRSGRVVWTDLSSTLIRDPAGKPLYFITSLQDITERKRAEGELRESEERFRSITESTPTPVTITRPDGEIVYVNQAAAQLFRLGAEGAKGRNAAEFYADPADRPLLRERILQEGAISAYEIQFRRADGSRVWAMVNLKLMTFQGGPAILGSFVDITARKEAEQLLKKAHEQLEARVEERTAELARANALLQDEIGERKRAEHALRLMLEGTAAVTGGSFFRSLVRHLASALNVRYATVIQGSRPGWARTLAFWDGSGFAGPVDYELKGTPNEDVLGGEACSYAHDVQRLFPEDRMLVEMGVDSYLGVPMLDSSGRIVGILSVMDGSPVSDEERKLSVLKIFAARAGVELERQLAEDAVRASEERWRSLVANAPDVILTVDRAGTIESINRTVTGMRPEEPIGRKVYEFVPPSSVAMVRDAMEKVFRDGKPTSYETKAPGPHGSTAWYNTRVGPIKIAGEVVGATFIATDITERRQSEQRQKVQHEVTRVLAEAATLQEAMPRILQHVGEGLDWQAGLLWKIDPSMNVLRMAEGWSSPSPAHRAFIADCRSLSYGPGVGLPGLTWRSGVPVWTPDVQQDPRVAWSELAARAGLRASFLLPVEGPEGIFGVIEFFSEDRRDRDEPLLRVAATLGSQVGQFIERKRAEEDLRFQKSLLESQSEVAIDGILVVSRDGVMTSFNRRFTQMWDIPSEVLNSRTDENALQAVLDKLEDPKEFLSRVRHLYDHPDEESRDEIRLKDGRAFDRYSAPVKGGDGELYGRVWYFRDITGRKQTEENLRRAAEETRRAYDDLKEAQAQLIRSEKLASIGMLVSGVAHEINNPLNVMYGNLQLIAEASDLLLPLSVQGAQRKGLRGTSSRVAKFRGMIRDALKAARHAREIIHDFRNFARDTRTAELVDLNECLEEAVTLIQRELKPGIRVLRKLGRIPQVRCLRGQMSQVFLNLLKNAGEAIEKKGTVTLRTLKKGGSVLVEVSDTGRGMAEDVRAKLFEPFFTTKPVGKGLGLGLSISAMIVHNHNGRITVRSRPGKGSVFQVELPLQS